MTVATRNIAWLYNEHPYQSDNTPGGGQTLPVVRSDLVGYGIWWIDCDFAVEKRYNAIVIFKLLYLFVRYLNIHQHHSCYINIYIIYGMLGCQFSVFQSRGILVYKILTSFCSSSRACLVRTPGERPETPELKHWRAAVSLIARIGQSRARGSF